MIKTLWPIVALSLSFAPAKGQSCGLLVGVRTDHLRAAGMNWAPSTGLVTGVFVPFYVGNQFVLRAEGGVTAERFTGTSERTGASASTLVSASGALVGRYYFSRKLTCTTGLEYRDYMATGATIGGSNGEGLLRPNDIGVLFGAAYRFSDAFELGVRNSQGMLPAADLGSYGWAKHRSWALMASYLLKYKPEPFAKRRKSRLPPLSACRY